MNSVVESFVRQSPVEDDEIWFVLLAVEDVMALVTFEPILVSVSVKFKVAFLLLSNCIYYRLKITSLQIKRCDAIIYQSEEW